MTSSLVLVLLSPLLLAQAFDFACPEVPECFVDPCSVAQLDCPGTCVSDCNCNAICQCSSDADCLGSGICQDMFVASSNQNVRVCAAQEGDACGGYTPNPAMCGPGLVCSTDPQIADLPGVCTRIAVPTACVADSECSGDSYCSFAGHCTPAGGCDVASDCSNPANSYPMIECVGTNMCTSAGQCSVVCGDTPPSCSVDSDCGLGMFCLDGLCSQPIYSTQCAAAQCPQYPGTPSDEVCDDGSNPEQVCIVGEMSINDDTTESRRRHGHGDSGRHHHGGNSQLPSCVWTSKCPNQGLICLDGIARQSCEGVAVIYVNPTYVPSDDDDSDVMTLAFMVAVPVFIVMLAAVVIFCVRARVQSQARTAALLFTSSLEPNVFVASDNTRFIPCNGGPPHDSSMYHA